MSLAWKILVLSIFIIVVFGLYFRRTIRKQVVQNTHSRKGQRPRPEILVEKEIERFEPYLHSLAKDGRVYSADAESLAEQGVLDFLFELAPFLAKQGIHLSDLKKMSHQNGAITFLLWGSNTRSTLT